MNAIITKFVARLMTPVGRWNTLDVIIPVKSASPLGRWSRETCEIKTNARIDRANEDHCGPCGNNSFNNVER